MKTSLRILLPVLITILSAQLLDAQNSYYGTVPPTTISTALNQNEISHIMTYWPLQNFKGSNKTDLFLMAVIYGRYHSTEKITGIKVTLSDNSNKDACIAKGASQFESYIEKAEYVKIIVAIDQMISELKKIQQNQTFGAMKYMSKGGICIGFELTENERYGYLGIQYSQALMLGRFSSPEKFLNELRSALNIATKELYLPKNENKLKRVKKGNQEIEDIKVDDI